MQFKRTKTLQGQYNLVAKDNTQKVVIRKNHKGLIDVVVFQISPRMTEIMGENFYDVKGEIITTYNTPVSMQDAEQDFHQYTTN